MLTEIKTQTEHFFLDENGELQGEYKQYWSNGPLRFHISYLNGKLNGDYKNYHDNGRLWEHRHYINSVPHGEYYRYCHNGELFRSTFFFHGTDLNVDPSTLTEKDKAYILLSGRLPPRD